MNGLRDISPILCRSDRARWRSISSPTASNLSRGSKSPPRDNRSPRRDSAYRQPLLPVSTAVVDGKITEIKEEYYGSPELVRRAGARAVPPREEAQRELKIARRARARR